MTIPVPRWMLPVLFFFGLTSNAQGADDMTPLLERVHPTCVKWGEIEVHETSHVRARVRGERRDFPFGLSLQFSVRERREDAAADAAPRVDSGFTPVGSVFLAATFEEGAKSFQRFREILLTRAARVDPAAFDRLLASFHAEVGSQEVHASAGSFRVVGCVATEGAEEGLWEVFGERAERGDDTRGGMSGFRDAGTGCADLRAALSAVPPDSILTTAFRVDEQIEESVRLVRRAFIDRDPVPLPTGARFEKREADSGARRYSATNPAGKGATRYEWFDADAVGSSGKTLVAEVAPAEIPRELVRGKGVIEVWVRTARERRLGTAPRTGQEQELEVLLGSFATTSADNLSRREEEFRDAVTRELDLVDGPIGAAHIRKALLAARPSLGAEDFFSVLCVPSSSARGWTAEYCVGPMPACSEVLNPDEACGEMVRAVGL